MNLKRSLAVLILLLTVLPVFSQNTDDFIIEYFIPTANVKNEYKSNACWSFSTTSFLEAELKRLYKIDIELSPMYFVYYNYLLQAENFLNKKGNARFSPGGLAFHALDVYDKWGCVPGNVYEARLPAARYNYQSVYYPVKRILESALGSNSDENAVLAEVKKTLDENMAPLPESFEYKGTLYGPKDFAAAIGNIRTKDYCRITSYQDFGFYKECDLPVPANWKNETYYNIPLQEFLAVIDYAIKNGFTLIWDGDVTEYPIVTGQGIVNYKIGKVDLCQYPDDTSVTDTLRQATFRDQSTTEDHLSHLVGVARDKNGNTYYMLKDSAGTESFSKGFLYVSKSYLALKTISVIVHKDGIPVTIRNKLTNGM